MISVEEARLLMMMHARALPVEMTILSSCGSRYVVTDVVAPFDHPLFDTSAVDGYALGQDAGRKEWKVVGEIAAGEALPMALRAGECARIFTGALVPEGTEAVVMQEFATRTDDHITHNDARLRSGANIRQRAEQIRNGDVVLSAGERLNPASLGLLASVGVTGVEVVRVPEVSVIITGGEFAQDGSPRLGQIFSSNDLMLDALTRQAGAIADPDAVPDDLPQLERAIRRALGDSDMVISTGGASVGDHDLVRTAVERCGGRVIFHGVAQKPGKPMLFALFGEKPFFGLPGNPRAVFVLFHEYVLPFLRKMQGAREPWSRTEQLPISQDLIVKGDRAEFRAAQVKAGMVVLLADEGSHMLRSLIDANALAYLPASRREWKAGDAIEVHYLPL